MNPYDNYKYNETEVTTEVFEYDKEGRVVKKTVTKTITRPYQHYGPTWTSGDGFSYSHLQYK
jgi:hypothetical protein